MVRYTNQEKYDMLIVYGECSENARAAVRLYRERYPNRSQPTKKTFGDLKKNLVNNGSFKQQRRHRQRPVTNNERTAEVLQSVENNPHISIRKISQEIQVSYSSCQRILSRNDFHPYRTHVVHHLRPEDPERRLNFIAQLADLYGNDNNIFEKILWSDESRFHNNGIVNLHNCHYWSDNNPKWTKVTGNQSKFGINVWCGILNGILIGPTFFEGSLTAQKYLDLLQNEIPGLLEDVPLATRELMWWQHDGAPAHNSGVVLDFLNNSYPGRWIGTNGPLRWPPRSPDITPLDFFLWGFLKEMVYAEPIEDMADLINKIYASCATISRHSLLSSCNQELKASSRNVHCRKWQCLRTFVINMFKLIFFYVFHLLSINKRPR